MLFKNKTHRDVWIESNCERCAHNPGCTILAKALRTDRKPVEWERNPRKTALMAETIRCKSKTRVLPRPKPLNIDVPMFDVTPVNTGSEGDHA